MGDILYLVVPCYNEEAVLEDTVKILRNKLRQMVADGMVSQHSKILFVDDGSRDSTWRMISDFCAESGEIMGIKLSHNQGHQNALYAGMMYAKEKCDCLISIDADLQDDVNVFPEFIEKYKAGCHIVYGIRKERKKDSFMKRTTAQGFYKFMNVMGAETIYNHADYRLMSKKALEALAEYDEVNLFLRGVVPLIGLKTDTVYYARKARMAGETKYPFKKMVNFALDGITSFSVKPLRMISSFGLLCSLFSVCGLLYALFSHFWGYTVPGWTAIVCSIWLLGGIQLLGIGVVGEYIGKIFSEVKRRPRYFIEEAIDHETIAERDAEKVNL